MRSLIKAAILIVPFVTQAEGAVEPTKYVMCRSQKVVRTIRIESNTEGCETVYTKAGIDRIVGSGRNVQTCVNVLNNIKGNLEEAHWKCREPNAAAVSDLVD